MNPPDSFTSDENKTREQLLWELHQLRNRINRLEATDLERRRIEKSLNKYEKNFRELVNLLPQTIYEMDNDGKFRFTNQVGFETFGYDQQDIDAGVNFSQLFIPEEREKLLRNIHKIYNNGDIEGHEYTALRKDGTTFQALIYSSPIFYDNKPVGLRGVVIDITDRKKVEQDLKDSRDQFRNLSAHLQSVREEERSYIAREIHDELGQALTALKMDLIWINKRLTSAQSEIAEKINSMFDLIDKTIQTIRRISTDLRPGLLDDLGLTAAIEWYCEDFQNRTGIHCDLHLRPAEIETDQERSIAIFRILQETLTNVARHAYASEVKVNLKIKDHALEMKIVDNGIGITDSQVNDPQNLGLVGLRERVYPWNGHITIKGRPQKGTTVLVFIPLDGNIR
ncbi:MAG TPA: PAS domain-containing sensor histidine kinase [Candidatus Marinimicrobia bacterium]|nr:PAS domain-containing sensor histidine kinase [Candidatus Neomarinimicrobiota bacterium]HRS51602.1 PAS domain-containing sensor histidine kinase [Candidatus Neomarinimicrobiota bacterium]HRU92320.1 PAS domain-containing sensor histidine kinase [Candidatus Neomarinimicrobiota bacterium]